MSTVIDELDNKAGVLPTYDDSEIKAKLAEVNEAVISLQSKATEWPKDAPLPAELQTMRGEIKALAETVKTLPGDYSKVVDALKADVAEMKSSMEMVSAAGGPAVFGGLVDEIKSSAEFKNLFDASGKPRHFSGFQGKSEITSIVANELEQLYGVKAVTPISTDDVSGAIQPAYRPGVASEPRWANNALSRIPKKVVSGTTTYVIPKESAASQSGYITSTLEVAIDGDPTPKSEATFNEVEGFLPGTIVRFFDASADNALLGSAEIVSVDSGTRVVTFVTDSLDFDAAIGDRVCSENFGATSEGDQKPYSYAEIGELSYTFKILATLMPVNVATLKTLIGFRQWVETEMPERWMRNLSWHVLYGTDDTQSLQGFRTYSGAQSYLWSGGQSGDNRVDAVIRAAMLIPWTAPIGVIMSQVDLDKMLLEKGTDGHYIQSNVFGQVSLTQAGGSWYLGPYELVFDYSCVEGDFTVVNWDEASEFLDQGTADLLWGYEDDDFSKNVIKARYEGTVLHAIRSTLSFVVGEWDSAPA